MAEIVVGLLGPLIQIAPFIKRQFSYFCCLNSNVNSLDEEAKGLDDARAALQQKIDEAENGARVIHSKVLSWMKKVDEIQQRKSELDTKIRDSGCLSVKSRYSISREAVKTAEAMKKTKLEDPSAAMTDISHPLPPTAVAPDCLQNPMTEFQSRRRIEKDLIALLKDEQANMLGLWGMGGVGKTTLANKIKNKMMEENVFGESVMAVVSQTPNMEKIQEDIASQLGLKFDDHEKSLLSRAPKLCTRLRCKKRILIVLDDIWEYLDLKELGIPCESGPKGSKILLTSRKRNILGEMKVLKENVLEMQTLSEDEALSFFQEQLGTSANQFPRLEQQITKECKGLPLALAIVVRVLKSQMDINVWEDALGELRRSSPEDLQDVIKGVYNSIKLSYDNLTSNAQSIFLLCSLFPEDFNIPLADLTVYVTGLRMFKGIGDLETIRTKTYSLVNMLKSCALLLGRNDEHVRMHDIVRDVAIFIASKDPKDVPLIRSGYNSTWITPFVGGERIELSKGSTFPNLHLLLIDKLAAEELQISGIFFEGMKKLNVLSICNEWSLTSLPLTTPNLRTLILVNCESLKSISVVGELLDLEILICRECNAMEEIPLETVKCLKLLEISWCKALQKIGSAGHQTQHIKILSKLESLRLWNLRNLTDFYQGIESIEFPLLTQLEIKDCPKLKGIVSKGTESVRMGDDGDDHSLHLLCNQKVSFGKLRTLKLDCFRNCNKVLCSSEVPVSSFTHLEELTLSNLPKLKTFCNSALWLPQLLKLLIYECSEMRSFNSGSLNMNNLETLFICDCGMMEHVFLWSEEENEKTITFPKLTTLHLMFLPRLTCICKGVESIDFPLLTHMQIKDCPKYKGLASAGSNKAHIYL